MDETEKELTMNHLTTRRTAPRLAAALAGVVAVIGLTAGPGTAAVDEMGGHHTVKNVVTEQTCYRTVTTTFHRYAGRYWFPVGHRTRWHVEQCSWSHYWLQPYRR